MVVMDNLVTILYSQYFVINYYHFLGKAADCSNMGLAFGLDVYSYCWFCSLLFLRKRDLQGKIFDMRSQARLVY